MPSKFRHSSNPFGTVNDAAATAADTRGSMISLLKALVGSALGSGSTSTKVQGNAADGIAVSGNPNLIAGKDAGGLTQTIITDAAGELQVDVLTLPALVAGTANIGDVDVLTLPALPAGTNNIGDVDVLTVPALVTGTATIGAVKDAGPNWTKAHTFTSSADASGAGVDLTAAPTGGQKIVIHSMVISTLTALVLTFEEETSGTDVFKLNLAANSQPVRISELHVKLPTADKKLRLVASGAGQVDVLVTYYSEA